LGLILRIPFGNECYNFMEFWSSCCILC